MCHERTRFPSRCRDDSPPESGWLWSRPVLRADLYYDLGNRGGAALVPIASKRFAAFHEPLAENWADKRSDILDQRCSLRAYRMGHLSDAPIFRQRRPARSVCSARPSSRAGRVVACRRFSRSAVLHNHGWAGWVVHGPGPPVFSALSYPAVCPVGFGTRWSTERRTWLARVRTATLSPKALPSGSKHRFRRAVGVLALASFLHPWLRAVRLLVRPLRGRRCVLLYFHDGSASWYPRQRAYRRFVTHLCRCYIRTVAFHAQQSAASALASALLATSLAYCRRSDSHLRRSFLVCPTVRIISMHSLTESDRTPNEQR